MENSNITQEKRKSSENDASQHVEALKHKTNLMKSNRTYVLPAAHAEALDFVERGFEIIGGDGLHHRANVHDIGWVGPH